MPFVCSDGIKLQTLNVVSLSPSLENFNDDEHVEFLPRSCTRSRLFYLQIQEDLPLKASARIINIIFEEDFGL